MPCEPTKTRQWVQLLLLTAAHFYVDMFAGLLPALLPEIRTFYQLSLTRAVALITVSGIVCNGVQLLTGHLRATRTRTLFIPLGVLLATTTALLSLLPAGARAEGLLYVLVAISGTGIAITHPEGLRALHPLTRIPPSVSTALFMTGGFFGFAAGAWITTELVARWQFPGLLVLPPAALLLAAAIVVARIRLPVAGPADATPAPAPTLTPPFPWLFAMAVAASISSTAIVGLLPTLLHELGFDLRFGGLSVMVLGSAGAVGSLAWATVAHRRGELIPCAVCLLLGVPFFIAYQALVPHRLAVWLLVPAGLASLGAYPLLVTMARRLPSGNLGRRMALIVGGDWGIAGLTLQLLGSLAARVGVRNVLNYAWTGYCAAGIMALIFVAARRRKTSAPRPTA